MRLKLISVFLLGSLLAGTPVSAQKKEQKSVLKKGPNVSLNITSKKKFPQRTYFNLGLFSNYPCLNGVGINAISSLQHYNAYGLQISGLTNVSGLKSTGVQISGIANVTGKRACGFIFSGLTNVTGTSAYGLSVAGLGNISGGDIKGMGIAGLVNVSEDFRGVAIAGLANVNKDVQAGLILSGLMNVSGTSSRGVQLTSLLNVTGKSNEGWQLAGLGNVSVENKGVQSALLNYSVENKGVQLGIGNVNTKSDARGYQIGIINVSTDSTAHQIGCINLNPETRVQMIISGGNANKGSLSIRFKNKFTYTQIGAGAYYLGTDRPVSVSGFYRAGVYHSLTKKLDLSADIGYYHIESLDNKNQGIPARLYALEPRISLEYSLTKKFGLFVSGGYGWTRTYKGSHAFDQKMVIEAGMVLF